MSQRCKRYRARYSAGQRARLPRRKASRMIAWMNRMVPPAAGCLEPASGFGPTITGLHISYQQKPGRSFERHGFLKATRKCPPRWRKLCQRAHARLNEDRVIAKQCWNCDCGSGMRTPGVALSGAFWRFSRGLRRHSAHDFSAAGRSSEKGCGSSSNTVDLGTTRCGSLR